MDKYTKIVFSIIAVCLIAITIKLWEPAPAYSGFLDKGPTVGDWMDLRNLKGEMRKKEVDRIRRSMPLVKVYGTVDVSGSVDVSDSTVEVSGSVDVSGSSVNCY